MKTLIFLHCWGITPGRASDRRRQERTEESIEQPEQELWAAACNKQYLAMVVLKCDVNVIYIIDSLIHSLFIHSFIHSFIHLFVHLLMYLFYVIHSFIYVDVFGGRVDVYDGLMKL